MVGSASSWEFPSPFLDHETLMDAHFVPYEADDLMLAEPPSEIEKQLNRFTSTVREKARWWTRVHKPAVVARWKTAAAAQGVSDAMFDFALQQLRHQASQCKEDGIRPSPVPGVFESDALLEDPLRQDILAALQPLEDVPDAQKDWHPRSKRKVLDLVHPSLFPLVYGLSRQVKASAAPEGEGGSTAPGNNPPEMLPAPNDSAAARSKIAEAVAAAPTWHSPQFDAWKTKMGSGAPITDGPRTVEEFWSNKFQWLPADVLVGADGRVVFDSYVNNMHPERHAALYAATARLVERMLPLLELTLAASMHPPHRVAVTPEYGDRWQPATARELWKDMLRSGEAKELVNTTREVRHFACGGEVQDIGEPDYVDVVDEDFDSEEVEDEIEERWKSERQWVDETLPDVFQPRGLPRPLDLKRRRLQVIVRYAEIVLTPERPQYRGGRWHMEGFQNEDIVATCVAYLASENVTTSRVVFRSTVVARHCPDSEAEESDGECTRLQYYSTAENPLRESLGSTLCVPGRMVCWPNAFEHRVGPLKLIDATRPGVRKIAAVCLVHPGERVLSTRDVPPQQLAWHDGGPQLGSAMPEAATANKRRLAAMRDFPVTLERAQKLRVELMNERP